MLEGLGRGRMRLRVGDGVLLGAALALLLVGILTVYSSTVLTEIARPGYFLRHLVAAGVGLACGVLLAWLPPRGLDDLSPWIYALAMLLLAAVLVVGEAHGGARRWLPLGPLHMQPSEPAKLALILFLAHYLAGRRRDLARGGSIVGALLIIAVPFALVVRQPDLGTALAFAATGTLMLVWAGMPWLTLGVLVSPLVTAILAGLRLVGTALSPLWSLAWIPVAAVWVMVLRHRRVGWHWVALFLCVHLIVAFQTPRLWNSLAPYQQARVSTFLDPERDPSGAGYQVIQSKIAIGAGSFSGRGFGRGSQKALSFLPRQHTDFAYSVIGEELGFLGAAGVLVLFAVFLLRALELARRIRTPFGSLVAVGVAALIFYHGAINIGMTLGLVPVTGLPLPFLSFGGSFLVTTLAAVGLLLGVAARRAER